MAKIERKTQKIFAGNGLTDDIAAFGSFVSGTPVYTDDVEALQTTAYTQGWGSAIAANEAPFLEEMNGVQYGITTQIAYLLQNSVAEYDENTTYYANTSFCQVDGVIYQSLIDENIGNNPLTDTTSWRVYFDYSNTPTLDGVNEFTGTNNFSTLLEYDGVEVANIDLSNISTNGQNVVGTLASPSTDELVNISLSASGSNFTATANGYYCLSCDNITTAGYIELVYSGLDWNVGQSASTTTTGENLKVILPVKNGQTIIVNYTAAGTFHFGFIPLG